MCNIPFDKIFIVHLSDNKERYNFIKDWTREYKIEDKINIWYTTRRNISQLCGKLVDSVQTYDYKMLNNPEVFGRVFDCAFQHLSIIKTSYERGLESILIIEDDFGFSEGIEKLNEVFSNLPNDWDVIKFDTFFNKGWYTENGDYFRECYDEDMIFGTMCYALNRNGMKAVIDSYQNDFLPSDIALYNGFKDKQVKAYITNYRIGRLLSCESSIEMD